MPPTITPTAATPVAQTAAVTQAAAPTKGGGPASTNDLMTTLQSLVGVLGALSAALGASNISGGGAAAAPPALPAVSTDVAALQQSTRTTQDLSETQKMVSDNAEGAVGAWMPGYSNALQPMPAGLTQNNTQAANSGAAFARALSVTQQVPLQSAGHTAANVSALAKASQGRVQQLGAAMQTDHQSGSVRIVDAAKYMMERTHAAQLQTLGTQLAQYGALTPNEDAAIMQVVQQANQKGSFDASALAQALLPIQARLGGFSPTEFSPAIQRLHGLESQITQQTVTLAMNADKTGVVDRAAAKAVMATSEQAKNLSRAINQSVQQARANPAAAALIGSQIR